MSSDIPDVPLGGLKSPQIEKHLTQNRNKSRDEKCDKKELTGTFGYEPSLALKPLKCFGGKKGNLF